MHTLLKSVIYSTFSTKNSRILCRCWKPQDICLSIYLYYYFDCGRYISLYFLPSVRSNTTAQHESFLRPPRNCIPMIMYMSRIMENTKFILFNLSTHAYESIATMQCIHVPMCFPSGKQGGECLQLGNINTLQSQLSIFIHFTWIIFYSVWPVRYVYTYIYIYIICKGEERERDKKKLLLLQFFLLCVASIYGYILICTYFTRMCYNVCT